MLYDIIYYGSFVVPMVLVLYFSSGKHGARALHT